MHSLLGTDFSSPGDSPPSPLSHIAAFCLDAHTLNPLQNHGQLSCLQFRYQRPPMQANHPSFCFEHLLAFPIPLCNTSYHHGLRPAFPAAASVSPGQTHKSPWSATPRAPSPGLLLPEASVSLRHFLDVVNWQQEWIHCLLTFLRAGNLTHPKTTRSRGRALAFSGRAGLCES